MLYTDVRVVELVHRIDFFEKIVQVRRQPELDCLHGHRLITVHAW